MTRNRLADETSPYLLQHKDNPVHWWAWGPEALAEAKATGKPILLSVGYAACHWCHVMAHESFEHEATAEVMNELFVNVKVDREERPDVDAIYMSALHRLGEQGGWPLTMFLDSQAQPFFGGTYFPREARFGRPAFVDVLRTVARIHRDEPEKVATNTRALMAELEKSTKARVSTQRIVITNAVQADLARRMVQAVDLELGGLQGAPKFPQWSFFWLMWRGAIRFDIPEAKQAVLTTLTAICQGGIYDHLGGGFARYSVDEMWLAPHFEKMLYDNALLVDLLTEAWRETQDPLYAERIAETVDWLKREMVVDGGGFAASLDADSEGEEGKFYVWTKPEVIAALGDEDARFFGRVYDVQSAGNWEGKVILNRLRSKARLDESDEARLAALRHTLLDVRAQRIRPGFDDKVLADWNGLMIAALARAGAVFERPDWIDLAITAFDFVSRTLVVDGRLRHAWRDGRVTAPGTASDHANMIWAALRLYQVTGQKRFLDSALDLNSAFDAHYWLDAEGRYATSADDTSDVIVRLATGTDDATPNANSIQVSNLAALTLITGDMVYVNRAARMIDGFGPELAANLIAHTGLLAAEYDLSRPQTIALFQGGDDAQGLTRALHALSLPGALEFHDVTAPEAELPPMLDGKGPVNGLTTAFVCVGPQCSLPVTEAHDLRERLLETRSEPVNPAA